MIEEWKEAIDNHQIVGTVAIDLSKAFDSLPHGLLLAKLSAYGLDINFCILMASYLYNQHQRVKIGPHKSDWSEIKRAVPQGSILGPLLFNVFINDIFFLKLESSIFNYADDNFLSCVKSTVKWVENVLSGETAEFIKWCKNNSLDANVSNFQSMLLSTNGKNDMSLTINDVKIQVTDDMKVLGINMDYCLKFDKHIAYLCAKAGRQLNVLQRLKGSLDYSSCLTIYKTFITSNFNYCPIVWMFASKRSFTAIENIQKRVLWFVLNDYSQISKNYLMIAGCQEFKL